MVKLADPKAIFEVGDTVPARCTLIKTNLHLLWSNHPISVFEYLESDEVHGLNREDCLRHSNSRESTYISGMCNKLPNNPGYYIYINTKRNYNNRDLMATIFHEVMHYQFRMYEKYLMYNEEQAITEAEELAREIFDTIIKNPVLN